MKKVFLKMAIILSMLFLTLIPISAVAATVDSGTTGDVSWTLEDSGLLTISGNGSMGNWWAADSGAEWDTLKSSITSVVIEYGVTDIKQEAFLYCDKLEEINIPSSVTSIGYGAFLGCSSLTEINLPGSIQTIGQGAFLGCTGLTSMIVPINVTTIEDRAFENCYNLKSITIPASVREIGDFAFLRSGLTNIYVNESNADFSSADGSLFNKSKTKLIYFAGKTDTEYTVPSTVTSIGMCAFIECDTLKSITIGKNVTVIGDYAFTDCTQLTDVYYNGTQADWNAITTGADNDILAQATLHLIGTNTTVSNGVFTVTPVGLENGNKIIFACYESGRLSYAKIHTYAGEASVEFTPVSDCEYDEVKVMLWKDMETCMPLTNPENVPLK